MPLDPEALFAKITDGELVLLHSVIESGWKFRAHDTTRDARELAVTMTKLVEGAVVQEMARREISPIKVATRLMDIVVQRLPDPKEI